MFLATVLYEIIHRLTAFKVLQAVSRAKADGVSRYWHIWRSCSSDVRTGDTTISQVGLIWHCDADDGGHSHWRKIEQIEWRVFESRNHKIQ